MRNKSIKLTEDRHKEIQAVRKELETRYGITVSLPDTVMTGIRVLKQELKKDSFAGMKGKPDARD